MKLDKSDAFLIHSVIFAYSNSDVTFSEEDAAHLEELQSRLRDFVLQESEHDDCGECSHDEDEQDEYDEDEDDEEEDDEEEDLEEEEEEEEDEEPIELYVTPKVASDLSQVKVEAPDGSTVSLEFEDVGEPDVVDVLIDDGAVIIDGVIKVTVSKDCIAVHDGDQWHPFKVSKVPKMWKKTFPVDMIVGFHAGDEK
jgi:hypothetical protein